LKREEYLAQFDLKFIGLKTGKHQYSYTIDAEFFNCFPESLLKNADLHLHTILDKQSDDLFLIDLEFSGWVMLNCDRCLKEIHYPIDFQHRFILKVVNNSKEIIEDEDIKFVYKEDFKINLSEDINELVGLQVPLRKTCELAGESCDQEMIKILRNFSNIETEEKNLDPRWDNLKNVELN